MKVMNISDFNLNELNQLLDFTIEKCDKIFLTQLSTDKNPKILYQLKKYIIDSEKVYSWDGTIIGIDTIEDEKEREEALKTIYSIKHNIVCNKETVDIIRKYRINPKKGIFKFNSEFDIAFYKGDKFYFHTTAHEDMLVVNEEILKLFSNKENWLY